MVKNLFDKLTVLKIIDRIERLNPSTQGIWGKMTVSQMLAHCSASLEVATGQQFPPRRFLGRLLGPLLKSRYYGEKPFKRNNPTDKSFIISDERDFHIEKKRLLKLIYQFADGGSEKCTKHPHSFFGKLTPEEWGIGMFKHLDHHLRQFNV